MDHQELEEGAEKVKLLGIWSSPYVVKVTWALRIKCVVYDYIEEDLRNKSNLLLECNPMHKKVPVLIYQGKPIAESDVIIEFIDDVWKDSGHHILPEDPYERAMARSWSKFGLDKLSPLIWKWFTTQGKEQEDAYEAAMEQPLVLEKVLHENKFFGGEMIGFVDLSLGSLSYVIPIYEDITGVRMITSDKFPWLPAWMEGFLGLPLVKEHLLPLDKLWPRYQSIREAFLSK
uniref:glutathione transferase n=1 Tax=Oryza meridionalis TaxID=40149 RepID=A0A0E0F234_9ORYZ